jgi:hypothetical protein
MRVLHHVQCHLCPIKWICDFSADDASYKWSRGIYYGDEKALSNQDFEKLGLADLNCPIKRFLDVQQKEKTK